MNTQPEAMRLADELDVGDFDALTNYAAAAELRRLHEVNQELLAALKLADALLWGANMNAVVVKRKVKAAIARAEGTCKATRIE